MKMVSIPKPVIDNVILLLENMQYPDSSFQWGIALAKELKSIIYKTK